MAVEEEMMTLIMSWIMDGERRKIRSSKNYRMKNSAPKLKQNLMVVSYDVLCYASLSIL